MRLPARFRASSLLFAAAWASGCMLVAPLDGDEFAPGGAQGDSASSGGLGASGASSEPESGAGGDAEAGGAAGESGGPCRSNAECIEPGTQAYRCSETGECIALKTGACPLVYDSENAEHPNPIYIGAFAPLPLIQFEKSSVLFPFQLALRELSGSAYGGLLMPSGERRPLVMVVCDNCAADTTGSCTEKTIDEGVRHLVEDVGAPAILATLLPGDVRRVFEAHRDRNVFFLSPVGATSALTTLDDQDLVWTMLGQPNDLALVYRDLISELVEPYLRTIRGINRPLRVALLRGSDAFGIELSSLVVSSLVWNDKSALENGADYRGYDFDSLSPAEVVAELLDFVPDLVISTAGQEVTRAQTGVVALLEEDWDAYVSEVERPFYVLSPFNAGELGPLVQLLEAEAKGVDLEPTKRFIGIAAANAKDRTLQNDFAVNVRDAFPDANPDTGNYYDAFYFLSYAIYAAHSDDPRGPDIARGMHRLLAGDPYDVGFADIAKVTKALSDETSTIALQGTLGPPSFDDDGIRVDPGAVYCFSATGAGVSPYFDALRYERATGTFSGSFPCFSDFTP